jgi:hypothetical protein
MEPWLYGTSTGLSSVAILVAAVFWGWLWGPVGLLMSTPLTVCVVVLGKNVTQLRFLDVLLRDRPALKPAHSFYQRLLADDVSGAVRLVQAYAAENGEQGTPDAVFLPALKLMRRDRGRGDIDGPMEASILQAMRQVIDQLISEQAKPAAKQGTVIACGAHHQSEAPTLQAMQWLLKPAGVDVVAASSRLLPAEIEEMIRRENAAILFIAALPPGGLIQARYMCRRIRKNMPDLKIVVGYWKKTKNHQNLEAKIRASGASVVAATLLGARNQIAELATPPASPPA